MVVLHWLLFEAIFHFFNFKFDLYVGLSDLESKKKKKLRFIYTTITLHLTLRLTLDNTTISCNLIFVSLILISIANHIWTDMSRPL